MVLRQVMWQWYRPLNGLETGYMWPKFWPLIDNLSFSSAMWRRGQEVATPTWQGTAFQETLGAWASDLRPSMRFTIINTIFKWNAFMTTRSLRWDPGLHLPPFRRLWTAPVWAEDRDLGSRLQVMRHFLLVNTGNIYFSLVNTDNIYFSLVKTGSISCYRAAFEVQWASGQRTTALEIQWGCVQESAAVKVQWASGAGQSEWARAKPAHPASQTDTHQVTSPLIGHYWS